MTTLFYLFVVIFLVHEVFVLVMQKSVFAEYKIIRKRKKEKNLKAKDFSGTIKMYLFISLIYLFYCFAGLLTSQYPLFLLMILIALIPKKFLILMYIDSFVSIAILLFIILNKFHFHIDIANLILAQFS